MVNEIITLIIFAKYIFRDFHLVTAKRPLYQPNIPETFVDRDFVEGNVISHYRNHLFDIPHVTKSRNRKRRKNISHGMAPLKGVKPVRDKGGFRIDESSVMPNIRPPIPFTKITNLQVT